MRRGPRLAPLAALLCCAGPPGAVPVLVSDGRPAMGTVLEVTLVGRDPARAAEVLDALFAEVERLEAIFSRHRPESDLSRLNASAGRGPQPVPPELRELLAHALHFAEISGGSFDVSVGPLVTLWTQAAARDRLPDDAELQRARARVGPAGIALHPGGRVALRPGVSVDLGGVAKGYAVDRLGVLLRAAGVEAALLDFGRSSSLALGAPPGLPGWRLLARGPEEQPLGVLELRDRALSVSGSLGQALEIGGRRFGHVLDPRSGWPLSRRRQAFVVAPGAALAEALSKTLLVGGEGEGLARVEARAGCEGLLLDAGGDRFETSGWRRAAGFESLPARPSSGARRPPIQAPWRATRSAVRSATRTSRSPATSVRATSSTAPTAARPSG